MPAPSSRPGVGAPGPVVRPSFRDHRFVALLVGEGVNSIGSWASAIALWGFAAYRFGAGPTGVALLIVCWAALTAVLSPLLGVLVDRLGARRSLVLAYLGGAVAALGLAAAGSLPTLDVIAALYGVTRALAGPAGAALPPQLVGRDDLMATNSLLGGATQAGQVVGPVVASATLALAGFRAAFVVDAATYLVGVGVLLALPSHSVPRHPRSSWAAEMAQGMGIVVRQRRLRVIVAVGTALAFTSGALLVVEPLYARQVLHRPASQFALFEAAAGIGAILASLVIPAVRRYLESKHVLGLAATGYGLASCLFIGTSCVAMAYAGAFIWGVTGVVFSVVAVTTLQRLTPAHAHGRVLSLSSGLRSVSETVGLPLAGAILAGLGVQGGALVLAGVAVVVGLGAVAGTTRKSSEAR